MREKSSDDMLSAKLLLKLQQYWIISKESRVDAKPMLSLLHYRSIIKRSLPSNEGQLTR